jgi:hypothetical protein
LRDNNKNLEHLFGGCPIGNYFCVHSHCRSETFLGRSRWKAWFYAYPQCRSSAYVGGVYVILILRAWQTSHKVSTKLDKTQCKSKHHIWESFSNLNSMYGSSENSSFVMQELIMQHFLGFQKVNLQNSSVTRNMINSSSDLLISYLSIT